VAGVSDDDVNWSVCVCVCVCWRLKLVQLDVTSEKQIADVFEFVESHVGSEGIEYTVSQKTAGHFVFSFP